MTGAPPIPVLPALAATILTAAALYFGSGVFAPVAVSLFLIAILWPLQKALESRIPRLLALLLTLTATVVVLFGFGWMISWALGMVGRWLLANLGLFYALYAKTGAWLDGHGIFLTEQIGDRFNVLSLVRTFQDVAWRINGLIGFSLWVLIFTMLGLLEVSDFKRKLQSLGQQINTELMLEATQSISRKFRKYLLVRTFASILTGLVVWAFARVLDIELAAAWGIIAFALNYIPVLGPLIATVLPTFFTAAQFESWQMAVYVFLGLNVIQFIIGSYLEPRFSGSALAISPFIVVLAVFFWTFLWGIPGAFIGVPVTIAMLSACELNPSTRWIATLLSGPSQDQA
jgi:predicted PurR-regulated permease PerM